MRITQIQLRNIGPHRQLDVKLERGLIGLVGSNGAGKSTLVNAIYAALTNDFSRFSNVKSDIITNGSGKEDSYIRLRGVHRNQDFELTRWLRPNKNEFTIGDVSYTKANEVNDVITAQLNISKLVIDKYVFVDQWDMFGFLSQTASERAKTFQYLCGTEVAATIHKVCSDYVTKQKGYEVVDNSLELEESLAVAAQSMAEYQQTMDDCQTRMLTSAEHKAHQQILRQHEHAESAADELEVQQEQQRRWRESLATAQERLALAEARRNKMELWQEARSDRIKAAAQLLEHRAKHTLARQQQKKLETRIGNLKANLEQLEDDWAKLDPDAHLEPETRKVLVQQQHTLHVLREQAKKLLNMAAEAQCCALCNQPVTPEYVEQVKAEYRRNTTKFRLLEKQIEFADEYDAGLANYTRDKAQNQTDLTLAETQLEACLAQLEGATGDQDYLAAETLMEKFRESDNRLVEAMTAVTKYHRQTDVARGQIAGLEVTIQTRQEILDNAPTAAECQEAERRLAQHTQDTKTYEAARGAYEEAKRSHARTEETLAQLRLRLAEKTKIRNLLATISEAGDVFHWNNLPKTVSQANLELLVGDINENLELFNSPFFVESDADLTFKVYFPGKPPVKAKQLSGGQKVVLAIAFRAALDRVFGHDVGMMFLDEPTSGLDADNVNFFHEALQQLSQKVGADRQLVVITHVQDLGGVFDQLIEIHKE